MAFLARWRPDYAGTEVASLPKNVLEVSQIGSSVGWAANGGNDCAVGGAGGGRAANSPASLQTIGLPQQIDACRWPSHKGTNTDNPGTLITLESGPPLNVSAWRSATVLVHATGRWPMEYRVPLVRYGDHAFLRILCQDCYTASFLVTRIHSRMCLESFKWMLCVYNLSADDDEWHRRHITVLAARISSGLGSCTWYV
ncbi:hypothetical protein PISMIDRAFT_25582 [Pisolithus microcarpus 441]|uniref:Uncharacterized protein n=1 Tax=Pisolithus microcarpus 441 TaxID=765257 RepID=A0A0C9XLF4_9AGAM|nr:hypothetical protein PISMIDRAFT_25582 [Pisolithus microcarpus 441]